jgi:hypothetical protein
MDFLEKDLEEIIYTADREELKKRGLYISGKMYRQLRIGNYGVADIVTVECKKHLFEKCLDEIIVNIYELKKDKIGISAFLQAVKYAKGIKQYIEHKKYDERIGFNIYINLIGKKIDTTGEFCFINTVFRKVNFITYKIDINGLHFDSKHFYSLTQEGFDNGKI